MRATTAIASVLLIAGLTGGCQGKRVAELEAKIAKLEAETSKNEAQAKKFEAMQKAAAAKEEAERKKSPKEKGFTQEQWRNRRWTEDEKAAVIIYENYYRRQAFGQQIAAVTGLKALDYQWEHGGSLANAIIHAEEWDTPKWQNGMPTNVWMMIRAMRAQNPE